MISEATAASVRKMLEGVVGPGGTASGAAIQGYTLAGKTGTAEKVDQTASYSEEFYVASFVGFAPAKHPKLLVTVMVDEPKGEIYGGQVAAPAWRKIVNFALQYLKIGPTNLRGDCHARARDHALQPVRPVRGRRPARAGRAAARGAGARGRRLGVRARPRGGPRRRLRRRPRRTAAGPSATSRG